MGPAGALVRDRRPFGVAHDGVISIDPKAPPSCNPATAAPKLIVEMKYGIACPRSKLDTPGSRSPALGGAVGGALG